MLRLEDLHALLYLLRRFITPYWKLTALLVLLSMVSAFMLTLQPLTIAPAMQTVLTSDTPPARSLTELTLNNLGPTIINLLPVEQSQHASTLIFVTAGLYVAVTLAAATLQFAAYWLSVWVNASARRDIQVALYDHMMSLSMGYYVRQKSGDLASRFTSDTIETIASLDLALRQLLQSLMQIFIYSILLIRTNWQLALATLVVSLLHLGITRFLRDWIRIRTAESFQSLADISNRAQETFLSIRVIKSFAAERYELGRFTETARRLRLVGVQYGLVKNSETPLRLIADALAISTILLLTFNVLQTGGITVQGFILFVFLARQTITPASLLAQSLLRMQEGLGASRRVLEIFNTPPDLVDGPHPVPGFTDALCLEDVCFAYHSGLPVLKNIHLPIRKGEVIAIVGPSGAGKSTLADIILRLYDPTSGLVTLDGTDIRAFQQASYRQLFGVVSQESLLFNATIRDNIVYGRPIINEEAIAQAARIANADEFIQELPQGYDTLVGDRGIRLSGGQRQRIAIARAIYGNPAILVLDEATSSLDTHSERLVQQAIDRVLAGSTAVVIAHRLSTIINADKIVLLHRGQIEAVAPHHILLEISPTYRQLYELQFNTQQPLPAAAAAPLAVPAGHSTAHPHDEAGL